MTIYPMVPITRTSPNIIKPRTTFFTPPENIMTSTLFLPIVWASFTLLFLELHHSGFQNKASHGFSVSIFGRCLRLSIIFPLISPHFILLTPQCSFQVLCFSLVKLFTLKYMLTSFGNMRTATIAAPTTEEYKISDPLNQIILVHCARVSCYATSTNIYV